MRVLITKQLSGSIDGIQLSRFIKGLTYDVGTTVANFLLAEGAAVPTKEKAAALVLPIREVADVLFPPLSEAADSPRKKKKAARKKR
jgi:hypothetical protein